MRIADGVVPEVDELHDGMLATLEAVRSERDRARHLRSSARTATTSCFPRRPAGQGVREPRRVVVVRPGLKLAAYRLLRRDLGDDPVLVLDDVFAELDSGRRERLAGWSPTASRCSSRPRCRADVPDTLLGRGMPSWWVR